MDLSLPPEWVKFVEFELGSGAFQSPSEVIIAGLRRLKADHEAPQPRLPDTLEELETMLMESATSLDAGRSVNADEVFASLRERSKAIRSNA